MAGRTITGGITSIVAADLNRDGKIDLAIGNTSSNLNYLMNDGAGNFTQTALGATSSAPKFVVTPDLNADGYAEVVWTDGISSTMERIASTITNGACRD
jgi:hypothetical protein